VRMVGIVRRTEERGGLRTKGIGTGRGEYGETDGHFGDQVGSSKAVSKDKTTQGIMRGGAIEEKRAEVHYGLRKEKRLNPVLSLLSRATISMVSQARTVCPYLLEPTGKGSEKARGSRLADRNRGEAERLTPIGRGKSR